jgi:hypothetical protein
MTNNHMRHLSAARAGVRPDLVQILHAVPSTMTLDSFSATVSTTCKSSYCTASGRIEEGHGVALLSQTFSTHQWLVGMVYGTTNSTDALPSLICSGVRR